MSNTLSMIQTIAKDIAQHGGTMYFVGGYVRDHLLGHKNKDIDIEIHGITVDETKNILEQYAPVDQIGASFGVLKMKKFDIDFTFPRYESKTGNKHTDFAINVDPYMGTTEAAKRRDFTMNAIMIDVLTNEIVDPFDGLKAIENKEINYVDKDTFVDDALRPLRAAQFASRLCFTIDPSIIEIAQTLEYHHLSNERIFAELNKALLSPKPSIAFKALFEMGVLQQILPELSILSTIDQDPIHHPEGNVFNHTMMVIDEGAKLKDNVHEPLFFMWACLLHDIGKATDHYIDADGHIRNNGHDLTGAKMVKPCLHRLTKNKKLIAYVEKMTKYHMRMHILLTMSDMKIKRIMLDSDMLDLLFLNKADTYGRDTSLTKKKTALNFDEKVKRIEQLSTHAFGEIQPIIQGKDLIALGLTPGPHFTTILNKTFELQLQNKTRSDLESFIQKKYLMESKGLISNKDLLAIGFKPGPLYKTLIHRSLELEQKGKSKNDILTTLKKEYEA